MNKRLIGIAAAIAAIAAAAWLGFSDGLEHRPADPADSPAR